MTKSPKEVDAYIGSRVRMRRKILGMTQEGLGQELGMTFQQVQKYEKGTNRIGAGRLKIIADILDVPVSFFYPASEDPDDHSDDHQNDELTLMQFLASSQGVELNKAFSKIKDDKVRRRIIALIHSVTDDKAS